MKDYIEKVKRTECTYSQAIDKSKGIKEIRKGAHYVLNWVESQAELLSDEDRRDFLVIIRDNINDMLDQKEYQISSREWNGQLHRKSKEN